MLADDFGSFVTLDALGAQIPTGDVSLRIEHENSVVPNSFDQQSEALLAFAQSTLAFEHVQSLLQFGDVAKAFFFAHQWRSSDTSPE